MPDKPVPARMDAAVKQGLLDLVDYAAGQGWPASKTCEVLGLSQRRQRRWRRRQEGGEALDDVNRPGFDGGGDDTEGSLSWDRRSIPMSCGSGPRGRASEVLADLARARGAIRRIGEELGVHPEALRTWVKKAQVDGGLRPGTTTDQAQRIKELEKDVRELRRANAILNSASACLSRRSVSARPVDLPVHRDQEGGARGLADLQGAHWRRSQDRPEHLTHARRSRPPSARSLRDETLKAEISDETLKAEISKVHKNQLLGAGGPHDARDAGPP